MALLLYLPTHRFSTQPPIHDFGAVKTIAEYIDVHLGIDDEAEGKSAQVKKRTREQTGKFLKLSIYSKLTHLSSPAVEKFHSFREVHGAEWHANRHNVGQNFLEAFVRQVSCLIADPAALLTFVAFRISLKLTKSQLRLKSSR